MSRIVNYVKSWFSTDALISKLKNDAAKVLVEYQTAKVKIDDAKVYFETVKANTTRQFEELKKSTFERTQNAVDQLKEAIEDEEQDLNVKFNAALGKVGVKKQSVDALHKSISSLGSDEYPLSE